MGLQGGQEALLSHSENQADGAGTIPHVAGKELGGSHAGS